MFSLGWGEIVVIGIVALIAIGPKELPTVLRTLGQWMGKVRRMANEFQGQFQEALREAEFADLKKHADDISSSVAEFSNIDPLADAQKDMERAFEETPAVAADAPAAPVADAAGDRGAAAGGAGRPHKCRLRAARTGRAAARQKGRERRMSQE
jgi:sec-independent protein translocase protein TatB